MVRGVGSSFQLGQDVEVRSFIKGYRGAWFRCKIEEFDTTSDGRTRCRLKYLDYKDEMFHWTHEYQVNPCCPKSSTKLLEHMIRPLPPPIALKQDFSPSNYNQNDQVVIVNDDWEVGDKVDWWCNGCWWYCTITSVISKKIVKVSLPVPPLGEGKTYKTSVTKLRPALTWSLDTSWDLNTKVRSTGKPLGELTIVNKGENNAPDKKPNEDAKVKSIPKWSILRTLTKFHQEDNDVLRKRKQRYGQDGTNGKRSKSENEQNSLTQVAKKTNWTKGI